MKNKTFLKVCCPRCKNCHIVYGKASVKVKCQSCNYMLVKTSGGKAKVRAAVKEILG